MLSFFVQIIFVFIIQIALIPVCLKEGGFLGDLLAWRYDVGHNAEYYEPVTNTSLIARVCRNNMGLSLQQCRRTPFSNVAAYITPVWDEPVLKHFNGSTLCIWCLLVWICTIGAELMSCRSLTYIVWKSAGDGASVFSKVEDGIKLTRLYRKRASAVTIFVVLPRLFIAFFLAFSGVNFLTHSYKLSDLLLNALALSLVMNVVNDWGEGSSRPRSSALGGRLTDEQFSSEILCDSEVHAKFSKPELVSENPLVVDIRHDGWY